MTYSVKSVHDNLFEIGDKPPNGVVPKKMYAWTVRENRFGPPLESMKVEIVDVPQPREGEIIIYNMAAGINYNAVWAGLGKPVNVLKNHGLYDEPHPFHICGSEASGIVFGVGKDVTRFKVGDEVIVIGNQYERNCPYIQKGKDPILSPSFRIWGYESNWGAFAQYSRVKQEQCFRKPPFLDWCEAASSFATAITAERMLTNYEENAIQPGNVVLIWGGYGGVGNMAIQIAKHYGGIPIAIVSNDERGKECMRFGAVGYINRKKFNHWGSVDQFMKNEKGRRRWLKGALRFRREIWNVLGKRKNPDIIIEHPGEQTLPTSLFVCEKGGMVVLCGGTTGYQGSLDLRFLWLEQKRLQGSHAGTKEEIERVLQHFREKVIRPNITRVLNWDEVAKGHQMLYENSHPGGNMSVKVGMK
ncbi:MULTISPECIES: crotonyl-CoA carboxylase/reductase [unclassified Bacillus cereus group]|uniref:crotonyl-CoA carboxylase/reductase n=1 Tax=unclassified Bacillus cereus group TaxID=2750818 RepID=UPI001F581407|nr:MULTISPECIES: crotonyl-CoA carboxylase/reductase [unclassified Bacillus cereus group]